MSLKQTLKNHTALAGTIFAIALIATGGTLYHTSSASAKPPVVAAPAPAIPVVVQTLAEQNVRTWSEFSGRLHAVDFAEIRPEVGGRIVAVKFQDGQMVKEDEVLFVIDPAPYDAAVAKADADVASAKTNAEFAKTELGRAEGLIKTNAIAQRVYDERANAARVADAALAAAVAELKSARLNLDHAYVKAPIAGRVSRAELTVGNLVQPGPAAPLLTSIASNKGIYADFEVDEQTYMQSMRAAKAGVEDGGQQNSDTQVPVELTVQGDEGHSYKGTIESFDNRIDTASGTIRARARFENADGSLMPGMTVSVKVGSLNEGSALLLPERAINNDQNKQFVYVVGPDNKVVYHAVELGKQIGSQRVVVSGVTAGDRVIVDGVQHVHPDAVVDPKEAVAETTPTPIQPAAVSTPDAPVKDAAVKEPDAMTPVAKDIDAKDAVVAEPADGKDPAVKSVAVK